MKKWKREPILLITIHRRYHELAKNLPLSLKMMEDELGIKPKVYVLWACPEISRLWFFQDLLDKEMVTEVIGRPPLLNENILGTTYPESVNIRKLLRRVSDLHIHTEHYAILQTADVLPRGDSYLFIASKMEEHEAVVFHWQNGCAREGVWHTNFFAVSLQEEYWPPLSSLEDQDVLERQWGKKLERTQPPRVFSWHNSESKRFVHSHDSENLPTFPLKGQSSREGLTLHVTGSQPLHLRLMGGVRSLLTKLRRWAWRMFSSSSIP